MAANQGKCPSLSSNVLVAKKYKSYEIYKRMCDVYGEA